MIYADYAATAPLMPEALDAMMPYMGGAFYNPSARYSEAIAVRKRIEAARADIAECIGASPSEIVFTSGATEACNTAIRCVSGSKEFGRVLYSDLEHKAVSEACKSLARSSGIVLEKIPVNCEGRVVLERLEAMIGWKNERPLVCVMMASNEVGTIQPIKEVAELVHKENGLLFCDATQAVGHIPVNVKDLHVDMMAFSGHKFGAPKGIGCLYVRRGLRTDPLLYGGGQEMGRRSGTENVCGIIGMAVALRERCSSMESNMDAESRKRNILINSLESSVAGIELTGSSYERLPGHASFIVNGVEGAAMVDELEARGVLISAGSACSSEGREPSRALLAMGYSEPEAWCGIRVTIDAKTTDEEMAEIAEKIIKSARCLRATGR